MKLLHAFEGGLLARGEGFVYITVAWLKMENREQKLNKHLMPGYSILGDKGKGDTICPIYVNVVAIICKSLVLVQPSPVQ